MILLEKIIGNFCRIFRKSEIKVRCLEWKTIPDIAMIEVTNACNFACAMCANRLMKRKKGYMRLNIFKLALDRCEEVGISFIKLYTVGEPILHPQFIEMWRMAISRTSFKEVTVSTNGFMMKENDIRELVKTKKGIIQYSFAGWNKESYEKIYARGEFEKAVEQIKLINKLIHQAGVPLEKLHIHGIVPRDQHNAIEKCITFLKNTVGLDSCQINIFTSHNWASFVNNNNQWISKYKQLLYKGKPLYCSIISNRIGILFDGRVTACGCHDINGDLIIGDISRQSIREIRRNIEFQKIIDQFNRGDLRGLICYRCDLVSKA